MDTKDTNDANNADNDVLIFLTAIKYVLRAYDIYDAIITNCYHTRSMYV